MHIKRVLLSLSLAVFGTASCFAQDASTIVEAKVRNDIGKAVEQTRARMMTLFADVELSDAQKADAMTIIKKEVPSLLAVREAQESSLNREQKRARKEAIAKLEKEGVKGAKVHMIAIEAMGLSVAEMKQYKAASAKVMAANAKITSQIVALLNKDQLAAMPQLRDGTFGGDLVTATQAVSLILPNML